MKSRPKGGSVEYRNGPENGDALRTTSHGLALLYVEFCRAWERYGIVDDETADLAMIMLQYMQRIHILGGLPSVWVLRSSINVYVDCYEAITEAYSMARGGHAHVRFWPEPLELPVCPLSNPVLYKAFFKSWRWIHSPISRARTIHSPCQSDEDEKQVEQVQDICANKIARNTAL